MLSKQTWEPELVLALIGAIAATWFFGQVAVAVLLQAQVAGFRTINSPGAVIFATMSLQGSALVLGSIFLKYSGAGWRDVFGPTNWTRCLRLALVVLVLAVPVMFALKAGSEKALDRLHWKFGDQKAVELIASTRSPWMGAYMAAFTVLIAPLGEEFLFRGLMFSFISRLRWQGLARLARKEGHVRFAWFLRQQFWRTLGYVSVSFIFAFIHHNAPIFLPLFVLALGLTWLYEKTGGLLAPFMAHSLFNGANFALLMLSEYHQTHP